jgi:osmotically-inducible protein OsmY
MMDEHRGKGPKGYQRSDARIEEDVNDRLSDDPVLDASNISVLVKEAEVTLEGFVNSRWDKRRAEDLVDDISGVKHVQNNLRVGNGASTLSGSTTV